MGTCGCTHLNDSHLVNEGNEPMPVPYASRPRTVSQEDDSTEVVSSLPTLDSGFESSAMSATPPIAIQRHPVSLKHLAGGGQKLSVVAEEDDSSHSATSPETGSDARERGCRRKAVTQIRDDFHSRQISQLDYFQRKDKQKKQVERERLKKEALAALKAAKIESVFDVLKMDSKLLITDAIPMSTSAAHRSAESLFTVATMSSDDYTNDLLVAAPTESRDQREEHSGHGLTDFIDDELFTAKTPLGGIPGFEHMFASDGENDEDEFRRGSFFGHVSKKKKKPFLVYGSDDEKDRDGSPVPAWMHSPRAKDRWDRRSVMSQDFTLEDAATDSESKERTRIYRRD